MLEPLTNNELDEMEDWGMLLLDTVTIDHLKSRRIVHTIRTLQDKNERLSSNIREMSRDCARLQKVLLDIGHKVSDVLGREVCAMALDLVGRVSLQNSWHCYCGMRHSKNLDSCCNCGRSK